MNEVQHPGFDKSEKYETFTTTNGLKEAAEHYASVTDPEAHGVDFIREVFIDNPSVVYKEGYEQAEKDIGWISVKDRLPEVGHFVLTCVSETGTPQCVGIALLLEDGTWWDGDMKVRVDYWMEVPKIKEEK